MVNENSSNVLDDLTEIGRKAELAFGDLTPAQINWRPSETGWSVGQCFAHLIKSNELFFDKLDDIAAGKHEPSLLEKFSPLSKVFGSLLIGSLKKDSRKFKAPTKKVVPPSEIDPNVIELFAAHQAELIGKIKNTETTDWKKTKITSPFLSIATYSLSDGYEAIAEHEKRHFRQAERVMKEINFPK